MGVGSAFSSGVMSSRESSGFLLGQCVALEPCHSSVSCPGSVYSTHTFCLASIQGFYIPSSLLLLFLHVSIIWNIPCSKLLFSLCLYLLIPKNPIHILPSPQWS
jgi:hypothetical protein